jgi:signal transduction histidine kinase
LAIVALVQAVALRGVARIIYAPMLTGATVGAAGAAASLWHQARAGTSSTDQTTRLYWIVECAALVLVAGGVLAELARVRLTSARIADAVLRDFPTAEGLRVALASSAGDENLSIVFPRADGTPVDGEGRAAAEANPAAVVTDVIRHGEVLAQLRHASVPRHAAGRLRESVRAARLALEHASSRARLRAELADLTASRARIVEVADEERRRLERNLHDGAQQRLIALSFALRRTANGEADVNRASQEILAALDELRSLAHGIHPTSLTDAGIGPAIRELAESSRVPMRLENEPVERSSPAIETAVYRVVADCVRAAERLGDGRPVSVSVASTAGHVSARVRLPGTNTRAVRAGLSHALDRVTALAGELEIVASSDGTAVEVTLRSGS